MLRLIWASGISGGMRTLQFVLLLTLGLCHGLFAKVVYVDDNASAGGDGTSWASDHSPSLRLMR